MFGAAIHRVGGDGARQGDAAAAIHTTVPTKITLSRITPLPPAPHSLLIHFLSGYQPLTQPHSF